MGDPELKDALAAERAEIDRALRRLLGRMRGVPAPLAAAMRHSLLGPGKRLRPILLLWTYDAVRAAGGRPRRDRESALAAACALECLHTYSLIHDDLPAMDDDVLRRGRPTCHVAFGEATAILAGDGLQAAAFGLLARAGGPVAGELVGLVAAAVGPQGMVGGQQDDLAAEGVAADARLVGRIHRRKTAALIAASVQAGALLAGAPPARVRELGVAGLDLGLAFQGADDLLDLTADAAALGKSPGKDLASGKATWIRSEGLAAAVARTRRHGRAGCRRLERALPAGPRRERLAALAQHLWRRDR